MSKDKLIKIRDDLEYTDNLKRVVAKNDENSVVLPVKIEIELYT